MGNGMFGRAVRSSTKAHLAPAAVPETTPLMALGHATDFPFENVVFEGGGNKGISYVGAVRALEEAGIWSGVRRLAGTSSGAMTAAILAVGYNSYKLEEFLSADLQEIFSDHRLGYLSLLPNLVFRYGWNSGKGLYRWFGNTLEAATDNADITFQQVYDKYDRELCIVVTNLSQMTTEYCHVKTTPNMPIRIAVRMSMAIPAFFQPVCYQRQGYMEMFVDGGLLCNYPIHCFDGWWLSMEEGDHFLQRVNPISYSQHVYDDTDRFDGFNERTVGILLYAADDREMFKEQLEKRLGKFDFDRLPNTELASLYKERHKDRHSIRNDHSSLETSAKNLIQGLQKQGFWANKKLTFAEFDYLINDKTQLSNEDTDNLFGDMSTQEVFDKMKASDTDQLEPGSVSRYLEKKGLDARRRYRMNDRRLDITNLTSFLLAVQDTTLLNAKRLNVQSIDIERTIGINTHYVDTLDFKLAHDDKQFLIEQGRLATYAFLKHYDEKRERERSLAEERLRTTTA